MYLVNSKFLACSADKCREDVSHSHHLQLKAFQCGPKKTVSKRKNFWACVVFLKCVRKIAKSDN
jgi:hypothetical protein